VRANKTETAFELHGPADAPVLVLIHGLGLTRATWNAFVPILAQDYRVLTYDLAGHGESQRPQEKPSLTLLAQQLMTLMDDLGIDRASLAGFSLGGMINRRFAIDHPLRVASLVILNSPHERSPDAQRLVEERAAQTQEGGPAATIDATLARWFTPQFLQAAPDSVAQIRALVLANDPAIYAAFRQVLASGVIELIRPQPAITAPTLVMTCAQDSGSTPAMSRAIALEIKGAETLIVPDLQHLGLIERPELFTQPIVRFLQRSLPPLYMTGTKP
jgi:pimeloyl-ACP methyl ester carboxylesterase